jgi:general L-amino acid transport system permease protein
MTVITDQTSQNQTPQRSSPLSWARGNLFNTWHNGLLTVVLGAVALAAATGLARALLGFDYTIIRVNLALFMVGQFPRDQLWRPSLATVIIALMVGIVTGSLSASNRDRARQAGLAYVRPKLGQLLRRFGPAWVLLIVLLSLTTTIGPTLVAVGALLGLVIGRALGWRFPPSVRRWTWLVAVVLIGAAYAALAAFGGLGWQEWGGLHLNLFLTFAGIILAFPIGLLLALGRRSTLPAIRALSVTYIELVRGVPLIAILLFGAFAVGFLLPEEVRPSLVTRMLIAIVAFEAAYVAEVVRGGLQAVPRSQSEAAQSLGMPMLRTTRLIVLPQALRATIPAMVGQFISLFKDTTLVAVLGVLELLEASFVVNSQPDFLGKGLFVVTLTFAGLIFWVGSYTMSREARRLEKKLGVGER